MGLDKVMQKMDAFLQKLDSMPKMFAVSIKRLGQNEGFKNINNVKSNR